MMMRRRMGILATGGAVLAMGIAVADSFADASDSSPRAARTGVMASALVSPWKLPSSPVFAALPLASFSSNGTSTFAAAVQARTECPAGEISSHAPVPFHNFYFTRGRFSGGNAAWRTDFNKADRQFLVVLRRILDIDPFPCENPVSLDDPDLRKFPFLYMVEVGQMNLTQAQADGLRDYLLAGGFLLMDDFWGNAEWNNAARHLEYILPEYKIVDVPMDHLIFRIVYPIEEVLQVPCECNARGGPAFYAEKGGDVPYLRGIFNESGRLMVAIAWNSDLGDAWEWAELPYYPWDRSNYAFQLAFNLITYAMTN